MSHQEDTHAYGVGWERTGALGRIRRTLVDLLRSAVSSYGGHNQWHDNRNAWGHRYFPDANTLASAGHDPDDKNPERPGNNQVSS